MAQDTTVLKSPISRRSLIQGAGGIGLLAFSAPLLAACSTDGGSGSSSGGARTISIMNRFDDPVSKKSFEDMAAGLKKATGITIQNQAQPDSGDTYQPAIRTAFSSSSPPSLAVDIAGPEVFNLAAAGKLADLTGIYQSTVKSRSTPAATLGSTVGSKVWGLASGPFIGNYFAYNADYLDKVGIDPTDLTDTDKFTAALEKIKSKGGQPITHGAKDQWPGGHYISFITQRRLGSAKATALYNRTVLPNQPATVKWTDDQVVKSFQDYVDLKPYFQDGFVGEAEASATSLFLSENNVGFHLGVSISQIQSTPPDFKVGMMLYPKVSGGNGDPKDVTLYNQTFIASKGTNESTLKDFFEYFTRPDVQSEWSASQFALPAYKYDKSKVNISDSKLAALYKTQLGWTDAAPAAALYNDELIDVNIYTKYIWQGSVGLMTGAITPEQLAEQLEAATVALQKTLK